MKAAVFEGVGLVSVKDVPRPTVKKPYDVLLKITACGICGTDVHILQDPPAHPAVDNTILGHEFAGTVVEVGSDVADLAPGDNVVVNPHPSCGSCRPCRMGRPEHCSNLYLGPDEQFPGLMGCLGITMNGGFAEYCVVPEHALYRIDPSVKPEVAALAEPLALIVHSLRRINVGVGDSAVVLGAGPIGLLFVIGLKANGATNIVVSDPSELSRKLALDCGAVAALNPLEQDIAEEVKSRIGPNGADIVVEAFGSLIPDAIGLVRDDGTIVQFGHDEHARPPIPVGEIVRKEIRITGSYGTVIGQFDFDRVVKLMQTNILPLDQIVTHVLPIDEIEHGLSMVRNREAMKVVIKPDAE